MSTQRLYITAPDSGSNSSGVKPADNPMGPWMTCDEVADQLTTLRAEVERLREALCQARKDIQGWASRCANYSRQRLDLAADLKSIDTALQGGRDE